MVSLMLVTFITTNHDMFPRQKKGRRDMNKGFISNLIKSHNPQIHTLIENNKYTRPLLKQLDVVWKKIHSLLEKDLKQKLVIK